MSLYTKEDGDPKVTSIIFTYLIVVFVIMGSFMAIMTDLYIKYLWVQTLEKSSNQIIYVPIGSDGLPLTEAGRAVK